MPSRVLNFESPCQKLLKNYPTTHIISTLPLKIFGSLVFVHNHDQTKSKLDPRAIKCIFLGYSPNKKGYKCYSPITHKFYTSMDVTFFENQPYFTQNSIQGENSQNECNFWYLTESQVSNRIPVDTTVEPEPTHILAETESASNNTPIEPSLSPKSSQTQTAHEKELRVYTRRNKPQEMVEIPIIPEQSHESEPISGNSGNHVVNDHNDNDLDVPIAIRKGVRECTKHSIYNFISYAGLSPKFRAFTTSLVDIEIPQNIYTALSKPEWKKAVEAEMEALEKNGTWELTDLPQGKRPVGCKWIFTVKIKPDGNLERYKARLVAKGFTQTYGIDYQETFSPVAKLNTIRVLFSLAANKDWPLHQFDVKNAFLHGDLEEEVFMEIPPGFETKANVNKVCRLRKSLYGLKQSPRAWFDRFTKVVKGQGYSQGQSDHTLFMKFSYDG